MKRLKADIKHTKHNQSPVKHTKVPIKRGSSQTLVAVVVHLLMRPRNVLISTTHPEAKEGRSNFRARMPKLLPIASSTLAQLFSRG